MKIKPPPCFTHSPFGQSGEGKRGDWELNEEIFSVAKTHALPLFACSFGPPFGETQIFEEHLSTLMKSAREVFDNGEDRPTERLLRVPTPVHPSVKSMSQKLWGLPEVDAQNTSPKVVKPDRELLVEDAVAEEAIVEEASVDVPIASDREMSRREILDMILKVFEGIEQIALETASYILHGLDADELEAVARRSAQEEDGHLTRPWSRVVRWHDAEHTAAQYVTRPHTDNFAVISTLLQVKVPAVQIESVRPVFGDSAELKGILWVYRGDLIATGSDSASGTLEFSRLDERQILQAGESRFPPVVHSAPLTTKDRLLFAHPYFAIEAFEIAEYLKERIFSLK